MPADSNAGAGAQPHDDTSLPFASSSLSLSLRAPVAPTLASIPSTIHLPTQISTLAVCLHPSSAAAPSSSRRNTRLNSAASSVISPLPASTPGLSRSFPSGAPAAAGRRRTLVWFRADLRLHDHEPLHAAVGASSSLLPVFVFDPRDFGKSPSGFDRTGPYRANFLLDSVADLRRSLRARGGDLVVRVGRPEVVIPELARAAGAEAVYAHGEVSRDECRAEDRVRKGLEKDGVDVKYFWGSTLYHVEDLPFRLEDMPSNYGGFREAVKGLEVRKVLEAPEEVKCVPMKNVLEPGDIPALGELGLTAPPAMAHDTKPAVGSTLIGGETEALERLKKFAEECSMHPNKANKDSTRDSIYGANFSCKISPWLATGCLSPRFMYDELKKHATRAIPNGSTPKNGDGSSDAGTNWLMFELLWRDFFSMGEKAMWDKANVKHFCDLCKIEVLAGHRPLGHLNKVGWKNVEEKFAEKTGRKLDHLQFKNKWDSLKRGYTCFMELKNAATGLGWDEAKQTVDCDDAWWQEHLARCHDPENGRKCKHVQFRKCGPANLESMHIMFGSAHVTGATASTPGNLSDDSSENEVHEVEDDVTLATLNKKKHKKRKTPSTIVIEEKEEKSPFLRLYKRTCMKIEEGVDNINTSVEASSAPPVTTQVPSLAEAMRMVKECGVKEKTALMHTATLLIMKPEGREVLKLFETNEGRLDFLEREHEKKL